MALETLVATLKNALGPVIERAHYEVAAERVLSGEQRRFWAENGYLILDRHFTQARVDEVNAHVDALWRDASRTRPPTVVDVFIGTPREKRMRLMDAPLEAKSQPYKLNDLYLESELIRRFVLERRLAEVVAELLGNPPLVCNTLSLEFGTQQPDHTDSLYMTPPQPDAMVASWIALEDVHPDAGPLRYWPRSHQIPHFRFSTGRITAVGVEMDDYRRYMEAECRRRGLAPATVSAASGSVFLWHSQLFHGGSAINTPGRTRKSLVTHYWRAKDISGVHGKVPGYGYYQVRSQQPVA